MKLKKLMTIVLSAALLFTGSGMNVYAEENVTDYVESENEADCAKVEDEAEDGETQEETVSDLDGQLQDEDSSFVIDRQNVYFRNFKGKIPSEPVMGKNVGIYNAGILKVTFEGENEIEFDGDYGFYGERGVQFVFKGTEKTIVKINGAKTAIKTSRGQVSFMDRSRDLNAVLEIEGEACGIDTAFVRISPGRGRIASVSTDAWIIKGKDAIRTDRATFTTGVNPIRVIGEDYGVKATGNVIISSYSGNGCEISGKTAVSCDNANINSKARTYEDTDKIILSGTEKSIDAKKQITYYSGFGGLDISGDVTAGEKVRINGSLKVENAVDGISSKYVALFPKKGNDIRIEASHDAINAKNGVCVIRGITDMSISLFGANRAIEASPYPFFGKVDMKAGDTEESAESVASYQNEKALLLSYGQITNIGEILPGDIPSEGIPEGMWIGGLSGEEYTGKAIIPDYRVYYGEKLLVEKKDYTAIYKNNINASTDENPAAVAIVGMGKYDGQFLEETFVIDPIDISMDEQIRVQPVYAAQETVDAMTPQMYRGSTLLKYGEDYIIEITDQEVADALSGASGILNYVGTGNYTGVREAEYFITDRPLVDTAKVTGIKASYALDPDVNEEDAFLGLVRPVPTSVSLDGKNLVLRSKEYDPEDAESEDGIGDYYLTYMNNSETGVGYVILHGCGEYSGVKYIPFKILGYNIASARVDVLDTGIQYSGEANKPTVSLSLSIHGQETELFEDSDYTVSYENNVNAGTGKIIFTGVGNYSGTKIQKFTIAPAPITDVDINVDPDGVYQVGGAVTNVTVNYNMIPLRNGVDYTVKYGNNKLVTDGLELADARKPYVKIVGKGNFKGTSDAFYFNIPQKDLEDIDLTVTDIEFKSRSGNFVPKFTVMDENNKKLTTKDYDARNTEYSYVTETEVINSGETVVRHADEKADPKDIVPGGTRMRMTLFAKEGGSFLNTKTETYKVLPVGKSIAKAKITLPKGITYTGRPITFGEDEITVSLGSKNNLTVLRNGTITEENPDGILDYKIVEYKSNVKAGTATVKIEGRGEYGGIRLVKFKIAKPKRK